jgi:hypothetical protein
MMSPFRRRGLAIALLHVSVWIAACAADPGDGPKSADAGGSAVVASSLPSESDAGEEDSGGGSTGSVDSGSVAPVMEASSPVEPVEVEAAADDAAVTSTPTPEAAPVEPSCTTCPLVVQYMTPNASATTQQITPYFEIMNNGTAAQDLTSLTLRYWFTADGSTSQSFACDYALVGNQLVQGAFVTMPTPTATADHYMEVSFTGGSIMAGSTSGAIQTRFYDTSYATFTQTNDYSFNAADAAYAQWNQVTLYRSGTLVWGVEP